MFVSDLDRPWHQTPFPIQGFHIRSQDDIRALVSHCKWVMVDVAEAREAKEVKGGSKPVFGKAFNKRGGGREQLQLPPLSIREPVTYETVTSLKKEMKTSKRLLDDVEVALDQLFETLRADGVPDLRPIRRDHQQNGEQRCSPA